MSRHFWKEGDTSRAMCEACSKLVEVRFEVRSLTLAERAIDVPHVLVGTCTECGAVALLPWQSTHRVREERERLESRTLEVKVPIHLDDMIHAIAAEFDTEIDRFRADLLRFYLSEVVVDDTFARRVRALGQSERASGRTRARVSLRAPGDLLDAARLEARAVGIRTDAQLVRGIILAAADDVFADVRAPRVAALAAVALSAGAVGWCADHAPPAPPR
jgi:hypothetical protein